MKTTDKKPVERVVLSETIKERLDEWIKDLTADCKGMKLSRRDLVEWLVQAREPQLSSSDKRSIKDTYFDEIAHTQWVLEELRAAKERGEGLTLADLLGTTSKRGGSRRVTKAEASGEKSHDGKDQGVVV